MYSTNYLFASEKIYFPGFGADPFGGSDPFASKSNGDAMKSDPFAANFADFGSGVCVSVLSA